MKKTLSMTALFLLAAILISLGACNNANPNIRKEEKKVEEYSVAVIDEKPTQNAEAFEGIDLDYYANRSYELRFLFAVPSFVSPERLSVNVLVQYGFCHLFYDNLCEIPKTDKPVYREASEEAIRKELEDQFGPLNVDLKTANLYAAGKGKFEMFEPNYGSELFYDVEGRLLKDGAYQVTTVFYTSSVKDEIMATTFLNLIERDGKILIKSLSSKQG